MFCARDPKQEDVRTFLKEMVAPDAEGFLTPTELFDVWSYWCRPRNIWSRTQTWFGIQLRHLEMTKKEYGCL